MKKSLIISWITCCDYPLFRAWLKKYGSFFDEILIYFDVQFRYPFYWSFIQQSLSEIPHITFLDPVPVEKDWRATSTTELINYATGDWIISIEQDWLCREWPSFFMGMEESMKESDMFGWWNPTNNPYVHPAFWGIKRELLEKTSKDFSAHPEINGSDHFAMITYDILQLQREQDTPIKIDKYGGDIFLDTLCFHLGGINQNYLNGLTPGFQFHRPEIFGVYNLESMKYGIGHDSPMFPLMQKVNDILQPTHEQKETWKAFFTI